MAICRPVGPAAKGSGEGTAHVHIWNVRYRVEVPKGHEVPRLSHSLGLDLIDKAKSEVANPTYDTYVVTVSRDLSVVERMLLQEHTRMRVNAAEIVLLNAQYMGTVVFLGGGLTLGGNTA